MSSRAKADGGRAAQRAPARSSTEVKPQAPSSLRLQRARMKPGVLDTGDILQLQRTLRNRAVARLLAGTALGQPLHARDDRTELPGHLKAGIDSLSAVSMEGVKVHYNSDQPAKVQALAYTQGSDIYLGPGQERHLPHEAWHVVQQKQGRVRPTMGMDDGIYVNDDERLEREADRAGSDAIASAPRTPERTSTADLGPVEAVLAPGVIQRTKIVGKDFTSVKHPISVLNDAFKTQLREYGGYPIQPGTNGPKKVQPSEFIGKIGVEVDRPNSIHATVEGPRRMGGARAAKTPQTEVGNLGEHERAMFGRPVTAKFNYAGGHLVSDKILGEDSYHAYNLAPQLRAFNTPAWRVMEVMAEKGPFDTAHNKYDTNVPIDMKVSVEYPDTSYVVNVADLVAWKLIPPTVTKTDSGATSLTIPRRVPHVWKATLEIDSEKYHDHVLKEDAVSAAPLKHFAGTDTAVMDPKVNPALKNQPEQGFVFGLSSATTSDTGFRVGGKDKETVMAVQAYPQSKEAQPLVGSSVALKPSAPPVFPSFLPTPIDISDFWIKVPPPEEAAEHQSALKRKREAREALQQVTDPVFCKGFEDAVRWRDMPKNRPEWGTFLNWWRVKKRKKDREIVKKLRIDTNVTGFT